MSDLPHPRDVYDFFGAEAAEVAFVSALEVGRLHHAWLITGPRGVGKATFAYRAARRLLGAAPDPALGVLGARRDDAVSRQIAARAHPDLLVIEREGADGKARRSIPVEEARGLSEFFAKSPGSAPYRVAIIDAADDLTLNAANAVLKTLEEPPARGVLFLVAHAPGGLLATIRSRCRRLAIAPSPISAVAGEAAARLGIDEDAAEALAAMAGGALGRALTLAEGGALQADAAARAILGALPGADEAALLALADGFRGEEGLARFSLLFERLAQAARDRALAGLDPRWAEAFARLTQLPGDVEGLNLDRTEALLTAVGELRSLARAERAAC